MDDNISKGIAGALEDVLRGYRNQFSFDTNEFREKVLRAVRDRIKITGDVLVRHVGEVKVFFHEVTAHTPNDDMAKWLDSRGFEPAHPLVLAAVNADDPEFAKSHPNGTQWKEGSTWHFVFYRYQDGKLVVKKDYDGRGSGWVPPSWVAYVLE